MKDNKIGLKKLLIILFIFIFLINFIFVIGLLTRNKNENITHNNGYSEKYSDNYVSDEDYNDYNHRGKYEIHID